MSSKNRSRDLQNDSCNIIDKYQIYFNRSIKATDEICRKIVSLKFKIIDFDPLVIEIESYPCEENLNKLITIFKKDLDGKRHEENKKKVKLQKQDSNSSSNDPCTSESWERVEDDLVSAFKSKVCLTSTDDSDTESKNMHFDVNNSNTNFDSLNFQLTEVNEHNLAKIFSQHEVDRNSAILEQHGNALKFTKGFSEVKTRENNPHVTEKLFSESDKYQSSSNDNNTENDRNADASLYHQITTDDKQLAFESHQQPDMNTSQNMEHKKNSMHNAVHKHNKKEQVSGNDPEKKLGLNKKAGISEQHVMPKSALGSQLNCKNKSTIKEASNQEKKNEPEIGLSEIGEKILDNTLENFQSIKKKEHTKKDDSDSEIEEMTPMVIKERKFKAACVFYRETDYYSCLKSAEKISSGYKLKFSAKGKLTELQSLLKDFKIFEIDGKEKTEDIITYVEKNIPSTRAFCFEGTILTLMGQKADLQAAKSKILSLIESNDEDTTVKDHTLSENTWQEDKVKIMQRPEDIDEKESKTKKGEKKSNCIDFVSEKKGTEKDLTSVIISIEKFKAAKYFYQGTSSLSNLSVVEVNTNTVKVTAENQGSKNLSILKDFETFKINAKKRAKHMERLLRKQFPETKTVCLEDNILFVMGQREDVEAVKRATPYLMDKCDDEENFGENICKSLTEKKLSSLENSGQATSQSQIKTSEKEGSEMQKSAENSPSRNSDVEMRSNNSDSKQEELTSKTLTKKIFQASKIFYKDTKYFSYLQYGVKNNDDYELKLSYEDLKAQEFLKELEDFKIFEIDGKEKTKEIITYVEKNFPATRAICFKGTILTLMGQKADLQAARSKILSMIGNNDEDITWSANKVAENSYQEEMKNKQGVESFDSMENNQSKKSEDVFNRQANETGARAKEKKGDENQYGFGRKDCKENKTEDRHIEMPYKNTPAFIGCSQLKVIVLKKDITLERVDCIVNAATPSLKQKGGVGGAIAKAAGSSMQQECDSYIKEQKYIPVSEIFVSGPGNLSVKKIIHAVGPKWDDYSDKEKSICDDDLRKTILRCLLAASKMKMSSIALPAVSSAGLKVPSNHCAYSYLNAVKHFDIITKELSLPPLRDIRFIDIKDEMVKTITDFFMNYWKKDTIDHLYQSDLDFARNYLKTDESKSTSKFETRNRAGSRSRIVSKQRQMSREYTKGNVKFGLSLKHAFDFRADLVVVIGHPFRKLSGLSSFYVGDLKVNNAKKNTKQVEFFYSQPYGKTTLNVCKLNIENETRKEIEKAFRNLKSVIEAKISVVITSSLLYPEENGGFKPDSQLLKTFCLLTYSSVMENLRDLSLLKYVTITASEEIMPVMIKCMDSELGFPGDDKKPSPQPERKFPTSPHSHYMSSNQSTSMLGKKDEDGTSVDQSKCCKLCCNESTNLIILSCCNEKVCLSCNQKLPSCPYCRVTFGKITGTQPSGTMSVLQTKFDAAGYEYAGSWVITYKFPHGKQESYHPNPGQFYSGCERKAYLPDVSEGFEILQLLRLAFIRGLTFTIGKSLTTNRDNVITWNDIHHKSSLNGGNYGFPDPTYFKRVKEELRVKGVNLENMTTEEKRDLDNFTHQCRVKKYFNSTFTTV